MKADVAIIGAGIAGASLAAELAPHCSVALIEGEATPGYHSTGRSAAFWHETLGGPLIQPLTRASHAALDAGGFLRRRASMQVATEQTLPLLDTFAEEFGSAGVRLARVDADGIRARMPRASARLVAGIVEEDGADIDVAAFHADCLTRAQRVGTVLLTDAPVTAIGDRRVDAGAETISCDIVVNAAGAWADGIATLAGARNLGIQPKRRTIVQVRVDGNDVPPDLPLVMDIAGGYYFRPEGANRLWLSPHDETAVDPHDVAPEEIDVAHAIARFEAATDWRVVAVERKWAGLRSFAPDRLPVFGFDADAPNLFWCAGQGGVGIQTAPAAARLCAHLILGDRAALPAGVDPRSFSAHRFA